MTKEARSAIVIGGGIAGTATAVALRYAGFQPVIYEAGEPAVDERGAFLTLAVNGINALRSLGMDPARVLARGFPTPSIALRGASGRLLAEVPLGGPLADGVVTTTIRRADLYAALRAEVAALGVPIVYGARLVAVSEGKRGEGERGEGRRGEGERGEGGRGERERGEGAQGKEKQGGGGGGEEAGEVTARFEDGRTASGRLLVGADGLHSRTRQVLNPGAPAPHYLGLLNAGGFTAGPVDGPPPGVMQMSFGRRAFFGWVSAPDGSVWWFANPPRKRPMEPGEFSPEAWRAYLMDLFAGEPAADFIAASDEIVGPWNTRDLRRVRVWQRGRIVLVGDAAHAVAPSSGQGAAMALEDAVALGRQLKERALREALAAYEASRRPRVEKVVAYGRRTSNGKVLGPVGAAIRDAMLPMIMRRMHRRGDPQAWILDHRMPSLTEAAGR
ncbi:FAD-dependent monooxygenase [Actinoplanes sp. NBC_00393]|uniref:FAD-dependent oxidoreductase n=1 Tax=Actinoplanes sp. NBC_00393 TaxID=2975953 RepID=UPI002E1D2159